MQHLVKSLSTLLFPASIWSAFNKDVVGAWIWEQHHPTALKLVTGSVIYVGMLLIILSEIQHKWSGMCKPRNKFPNQLLHNSQTAWESDGILISFIKVLLSIIKSFVSCPQLLYLSTHYISPLLTDYKLYTLPFLSSVKMVCIFSLLIQFVLLTKWTINLPETGNGK